MSGSLPSSLALTSIGAGAQILSADHRNNYLAIQAAVNALIAALGVSAKGDLLAATGTNAFTNVTVGSDNKILVADSTQTAGMKWAAGAVQIADSVLGGSAASFDFTGIPATFANLLIIIYARGDQATSANDIFMRFNNDSGANYDFTRLAIDGTTVSAAENLAQTTASVGSMAAGTATANFFDPCFVVIPHYAGSANQKAYTAQGRYRASTGGSGSGLRQLGGNWRSNSAINRVTLLPSGGNFVSGARATIYGLG